MPRRVKIAEDYVREHKDLAVEEVNGRKLLICKFCRVRIPIVTGKTASRITDHLASKTHWKLSPGTHRSRTQNTPRRLKNAEDYVRAHPDLSVEEGSGRKLLMCKYCRVSVPIISGKTASRIKDHLSSKTHLKLKTMYSSDDDLGQEPVAEMKPSFKREHEEKDLAHEFTRALVQSGTSLDQADGPIGDLFRKFAPAGEKIPTSTEMYCKYLPEVFKADLDHITALISGGIKISVTVDETPEMLGDPAVAVLFTFCDAENGWVRRTVMADLDIVETCNAVSISALLQKVLERFHKNWSDVVCIGSDSATYMKKLCDDLGKTVPEFKAIHVRDPCRLLDGVLKAALHSSELMRNAVDFVVHADTLFRYARKLKQKYFSFCTLYGMTGKMIPTVSSRWSVSLLDAVNAILSMWRPFTEFVLSDSADRKCDFLRTHIDNEIKKNTMYCTLRFLQENMPALGDIIKKLEGENTYIYQVYNAVGVEVKLLLEKKLGDTFNDFGYVTCALLECLPLGQQRTVEEMFRIYYSTMYDKWQVIMCRNLPSATMSFEVNEASLWYSVQVLDPFRKAEMPQNFEKYKFIFDCFDSRECICRQFNEYVAEGVPEYDHLQAALSCRSARGATTSESVKDSKPFCFNVLSFVLPDFELVSHPDYGDG
ncbi:hypothetical protein NDU88_001078 [Pleurodeles waltl]|uniref:Uncharacterized protein n=1 Tax=Pleurodeles waltl TaxID=8319 RepID=A0AAV7SZ96_PLEWA|nr:hypothetical protein NDU88_001078 [Pleurodeles waltl]